MSHATRGGAINPPSDEPLSKIATASPRSRVGNHSETTFVEAGQLPASPIPSRKRRIRNDQRPPAKACSRPAIDHQERKTAIPVRAPIRSTTAPETICMMVYATRNAPIMLE